MDAGWEVINMTQYPEAYLCRELGMAVVNIALITDYDAGVIEGTEAVTATMSSSVFKGERGPHPEGRAGHDRRFPTDLDALGAREALRYTRGDGARRLPEDIRMFETGL